MNNGIIWKSKGLKKNIQKMNYNAKKTKMEEFEKMSGLKENERKWKNETGCSKYKKKRDFLKIK